MAITVKHDDAARLIIARISGAVVMSELVAFERQHRTGEPRRYALIFDLRDVTSVPASDELRAFAELLVTSTRDAARGRAALVATEPSVYVAAHQLEQFCAAGGISTVRACRDFDEAIDWVRTDS
jgi:hypothetical protein